MIYENESLEELGVNGYKIIQEKNGFRFGSDAVLLASFTEVKKNSVVLDLCTGSGIIPTLMASKEVSARFFGLEILSDVSKRATRSVELNSLSDRITIVTGDLKESLSYFKKASFDLVTCNPPYRRANCGVLCPNDSKAIAKHEILCTLDDVVKNASLLLKSKGHFTMVHRADRLSDIITTLLKYNLEPKRILFVASHIKKSPDLVLTDSVKDGSFDVLVLPTFYLYDEKGNYNPPMEANFKC